MRLPKRGPYRGRLTFDPESEFHTDAKGRRVVTEDAGKTWRYARRSDASHNARYQKRVATVDTTANELARITALHGPDVAAATVGQHHFAPQEGDAHYDPTLPGLTQLQAHPDVDAVTVTSHTETYA